MRRPDAEQYYDAACQEIQSLLDKKTWELAKLPPGRKAIGCRWVFLIKRHSDGSVDRYKGRVVAQGFSQRPGFDYDQTFTPTPKWPAIRLIFALVAKEDLELESIDISTAFLYGKLDTPVYMRQIPGFHQGEPDDVLLLRQGLYGLKQSGRIWHEKLDKELQSMGFTKVQSDSSVWIFRKDDIRIILPAYVDDILIAAPKSINTQMGQG